MKPTGPLLPRDKHSVSEVTADRPAGPEAVVVTTRDHQVIRRWAVERQAEPATGEATKSGPATVRGVNDGGAGIRFNFPGVRLFRPISWEEWFENFDRHQLRFVCDNESAGAGTSARYRLVKAEEWDELTQGIAATPSPRGRSGKPEAPSVAAGSGSLPRATSIPGALESKRSVPIRQRCLRFFRSFLGRQPR
jgi:hypothetical protein